MCESNAFIIGPEGEKEVMKDVTRIKLEGRSAILTDIMGQKLVLVGVAVREMDLIGHRIIFHRV
ncbi:MAG: CooT family nickel-binding protein [Methanomassiliicoccales archaeon]|nr:MAG: CooT family nickel-binding protein [Methanomassiliicoccales archaeon]